MNDKIKIAISFAKEVIDYFESMPILTDDEQAILDSAEWTLDQLKNK